MSTDLYHRRLVYYPGRGGIAKEGDFELRLRVPPPVMPHLVEIDFGEIHPGLLTFPPFVREHLHSKVRDMTAEEIANARAWLASLHLAATTAAALPPVFVERRKPHGA